ncbi:MAG: hypothetical protein ACKOOI_11610, partial [Pirellula sp.]
VVGFNGAFLAISIVLLLFAAVAARVARPQLFGPSNDPHHGAAGVDVDFKTDCPPPLPCMRWFVAVLSCNMFAVNGW